MAGFKFRKTLRGDGVVPAELELVGANSIVFQIGDLIRINTGGFAALAVAGDLIYGVVTGVIDKNSGRTDPDADTLDIYTMTSDNQTVALRRIRCIPVLADYLFYNDADADFARTNLMQYFPINDENDVDGTTGNDSTINTVRLIAIDPDGDADASKGLFQIVESFWAQNCMGTVDTGGIEA